MEYSVFIEKVTDADFPEGYYYAYIPALDLTTHGKGIDGARDAARDLLELWLKEKQENNEPFHHEKESWIGRLEINAL